MKNSATVWIVYNKINKPVTYYFNRDYAEEESMDIEGTIKQGIYYINNLGYECVEPGNVATSWKMIEDNGY